MNVKKVKRICIRIPKILLCLILILTMTFGIMYKEPVVAHATGVEAVFAGAVAGATGVGLGAVAGGLVIAGAITALGIGVGATVSGRSYSEECQHIWNSITQKAKTGIVIAGVAAAPVIKFTHDAITEIDSQIKSRMDLASKSNVGYTFHSAAFDAEFPVQSLSNFNSSSIANLLHSSTFPISPSSGELFKFYAPCVTGAVLVANNDKLVPCFNYTVNNITHVMGMQQTMINSTKYYISLYIDDSCSSVISMPRPVQFAYPYLANFISGGAQRVQFGLLFRTDVGFSDSRSVGYTTNYDTVSMGNDVINVANEQWYAKELSSLNNKIDDLESRLEAAQGSTPGSGLSVHPPVAPGIPSLDAPTWD